MDKRTIKEGMTLNMYRVGVILPSRGLIFSKTAEEILKNLRGIDHKIFFSHKRPIPECFNEPLERALSEPNLTHILIVEDDMIIPPEALKNALEANENVVTYDYPINANNVGAVFQDITGKVIYCGTGFLLLKREVFDKLKAPYFRTDIQWSVVRHNESLRFKGAEVKQDGSYGLQDITFCMKLQKAGYDIKVLPTVLGQRKLIALGKVGSNNGAHYIQRWRKVKKDIRLNEYMSMPNDLTSKSNLITLETEGGYISTDKAHAEKLVDKGIGKEINSHQTAIDLTEVDI